MNVFLWGCARIPAPPTLRQGRAAACSPGFAKRKHRYGDVILFFPGPSGGGIGYGFGGLLRGVADLDREEVSERTGAVKQYWNVAAYDDAGDVVSDGVIMTKIVPLVHLEAKGEAGV